MVEHNSVVWSLSALHDVDAMFSGASSKHYSVMYGGYNYDLIAIQLQFGLATTIRRHGL